MNEKEIYIMIKEEVLISFFFFFHNLSLKEAVKKDKTEIIYYLLSKENKIDEGFLKVHLLMKLLFNLL